MKLFSYSTTNRQMKIGIEIDNRQYNFTQLWEIFKDIKGSHQTPPLMFLQVMIELTFFNLSDIKEVLDTVQKFRSLNDLRIIDQINFETPISRPQKILCIGRNYLAHAKELGNKKTGEPIFFAKMPSTLIPHKGRIQLPLDVGRVDHEIELAVVISRQCKNIPPANAMDYVAGFTIINDITARALQKSDIEKQHPWLRSKNFDTFCPIGPYLVPTAAIAAPQNLNLTLKVNGEVRQKSNTSKMIFKIPELISYLSKYMTLFPGDIIATGTPEGISELHSRDIIEAEIDELGKLENVVVSS